MADHLHLVSQERQRLEKTIDLGVQRHRSVEVPHIIEAVRSVGYLRGGVRVPLFPHLRCIHPVIQVYRRRHIYVIEHIECRRDRYVMLHAVAPVFDERLLEKLILLGRQRILQLARIAQFYLLIPFLVTCG